VRHKDFAQMSADELGAAMRYIREATLLWKQVPSRRLTSDPRGQRIDLRRTLRASLRAGGELIELKRRAPGQRLPTLVALLDISGSMSEYSRVVLHFLHALAENSGGVSCSAQR
jgi:uncharacterized protein with von Willebrand factor type A (vWA) domain